MDVLDTIDRLPFMPGPLAERALHRQYDKRQRVAAGDPTWAEIEARRHRDGGAGTIFLSEEHDLDLADWELQRSIEERLVPEPAWAGLARRAKHWGVARVANVVRYHWQLARRGWTDADVWNLSNTITERLAAQLDYLADHAHGWPGNDEFPNYEDWTAALREQAEALRGYTRRGDVDAAIHDWHEVASDHERNRGERREVADELHAEIGRLEDVRRQRAQDALVWVAEHLDMLWD